MKLDDIDTIAEDTVCSTWADHSQPNEASLPFIHRAPVPLDVAILHSLECSNDSPPASFIILSRGVGIVVSLAHGVFLVFVFEKISL
jgi:hypothetical protein